MKLLLDENLPQNLRLLLVGHECFTVTYMGWRGVENGKLLQLAAANGFDAFVSTDRGLEYEQNQATLPLAVMVIVAKDNKLKTIEALVPIVLRTLNEIKPRQFLKVQTER